ncbi:hypothetical protein HGA64_00930, partial [Candidatus Falkowbacteria bacterium]|nr:hypothetical protein [Candidatus Falkowbacteria bacterium]
MKKAIKSLVILIFAFSLASAVHAECICSCTLPGGTPGPSNVQSSLAVCQDNCVKSNGASAVGSCGGIVPDGESVKNPGKSKKEIGDYGVNDFVQIGVNVAYFIQGIIGSLALLMFIWGGFTLLMSQG